MTASNDGTSTGWLERRWHRLHRHPRFIICALIFVVLTVVLVLIGWDLGLSILLAFDVAAVIFLLATVLMFVRADTRSMRGRARKEDEGYWGFCSAALPSPSWRWWRWPSNCTRANKPAASRLR